MVIADDSKQYFLSVFWIALGEKEISMGINRER
jgi:hypothetical protein